MGCRDVLGGFIELVGKVADAIAEVKFGEFLTHKLVDDVAEVDGDFVDLGVGVDNGIAERSEVVKEGFAVFLRERGVSRRNGDGLVLDGGGWLGLHIWFPFLFLSSRVVEFVDGILEMLGGFLLGAGKVSC